MITGQDVLRLHDDLIRWTGGSRGVLHPAAVESIVDRAAYGPFARGGDPFEQAALLLRGIAQEHPFADGNKRTAFAAAVELLGAQGYYITVGPERIVEFMLRVAQAQEDVESIREWLEKNAEKD